MCAPGAKMESNLLNSGAGTGVLMSDGKPIPVAYDLIRSPDGAAEGQVFGEAKALEAAFLVGACTLQLESGAAVKAVLLGCESTGAASIRVAAAV